MTVTYEWLGTKINATYFLIGSLPYRIEGRSSCKTNKLILIQSVEVALLEGMIQEIRVANEMSIDSTEQNKSWDLKQTHLKGISGSNFHG